MTIMASGTVSRIDCRCASRASASRVISIGAHAAAVQQLADPGDADADVTMKAAPLTSTDSECVDCVDKHEDDAPPTLSTVAKQARSKPADAGRRSGPRGMKNRKIGSFGKIGRQHDCARPSQRDGDRRDAIARDPAALVTRRQTSDLFSRLQP